MKWNKGLILIFLSISIFAGCRKDKEIPLATLPPPVAVIKPKVTDYFPLTIGSYWIYEWHEIDTNGIDKLEGMDSVLISNDTMINNKKYFFTRSFIKYSYQSSYNKYGESFLRDSSDYIVDSKGKIWFSNTNFKDTLQVDSIYGIKLYLKMSYKDTTIKISLGTYSCYGTERFWKANNPDCMEKKSDYYFFAKGIGKVKDAQRLIYSCVSPRYEHRLIRYKINKE